MKLKYCLVGGIYRDTTEVEAGSIPRLYRIINLDTLKFYNIETSMLMDMDKGYYVEFESEIKNTYVIKNAKPVFIPEYGVRNIIIGKTSNCYLVTDGYELLKYMDIEDLCDTDSTGKIYKQNMANAIVSTSERIVKGTNREIRYIGGQELRYYKSFRSSKEYITEKTNQKLEMLNAGYYITSNRDVIVTDSEAIKIVTDQNMIRTIGKYGGFRECNNVTNVKLGDSVKIVCDRAFYKCESLKIVYIGKSLRYIGEEAFAFCNNLQRVVIMNGLVQIDKLAFANCNHIELIDIPKTVRVIADNAFMRSGITEIRVHSEKHRQRLTELQASNALCSKTIITLGE